MYEIYQVSMTGTLEDVANQLGINPELLEEINGIRRNFVLDVGSYIVVPKNQNENQNFITYTIQKGDTIIEIARKYNLDYKQLLDLNGLDKDEYLYIGQQILIPNKNTAFWITGDNDTLNDVVNKFSVTPMDIIESNENIFLRPDQMLIIRKKD